MIIVGTCIFCRESLTDLDEIKGGYKCPNCFINNDYDKIKNDLKPRKDSPLSVKNIREAVLRERELVGTR